jgi:hypothetical protein
MRLAWMQRQYVSLKVRKGWGLLGECLGRLGEFLGIFGGKKLTLGPE